MNYKQLLVDIRDALNGVAQPTVQVDALRSYLDKWEQNASATAKIDEAVHHRQLYHASPLEKKDKQVLQNQACFHLNN